MSSLSAAAMLCLFLIVNSVAKEIMLKFKSLWVGSHPRVIRINLPRSRFSICGRRVVGKNVRAREWWGVRGMLSSGPDMADVHADSLACVVVSARPTQDQANQNRSMGEEGAPKVPRDKELLTIDNCRGRDSHFSLRICLLVDWQYSGGWPTYTRAWSATDDDKDYDNDDKENIRLGWRQVDGSKTGDLKEVVEDR